MIDETPIVDPRRWVGAHADYLYSYAIARINDEEQAKDLVQETFLAALQTRQRKTPVRHMYEQYHSAYPGKTAPKTFPLLSGS